MNTLLRFVAGTLTGIVLAVWIPQLVGLPPLPILPEKSPGEAQSAEGQAEPVVQPASHQPKVMPLKVTVSETLHTGNPTESGQAMPEIKGTLPKNLRFRWLDDPASGLAPAFLWQKGDSFLLGTQRIAPQDGDIRAAYAFEAPAVLPDQYGGRLIFHKRVLARLLEWAESLGEVPENRPMVVVVRRTSLDSVALTLPATSSSPETHLQVKL
jgi:hypothetical protein